LPLLPAELRGPIVRFAVVPLASITLGAVLLITEATLGLRLTLWSIWLLLLGLAIAGVIAGTPERQPRQVAVDNGRVRELAGISLLGAVLALGATVQSLVVGAKPVPGDDWGHYLLYADQIAQRHSLALANPYWM